MRKQLFLIAAAVALAFTACTSDEVLQRLDQHDKDIAQLKGDVTALQGEVDRINSNIQALRTAIDALNSNVYVKEVTDVKDVSGNVIGYTILFTNGKNVTVYHGEKGDKGDPGDKGDQGDPGPKGDQGDPGTNGTNGTTPVITVEEYEGVLYWKVNGEWLRDSQGHLVPVTGEKGEKGDKGDQGDKGDKGDQGDKGDKGDKGDPGTGGGSGEAGQNGVTPQLRINEGNWEVSVDEGATWQVLAPAYDSSYFPDVVFSGVKETKSQVVFTLADGTKLAIDKYVDFVLSIDDSQAIDVVAGATVSIPYTLAGVGSGESRVDAVASGDWWAEVEATDKISGVVKVTAGTAEKAKVILYAVDGKGRADIRSLVFNGGTLTLTAPVADSPTDGGDVIVPVVTNVDYTVEIEKDAQYWLSCVVTKAGAVHNETLTLTVEKNNTPATRSGLVELKDPMGSVIQSFTVKQESGVYEYPVFEDNSFKNWVLYNSPAADYNENLKVDANEAAKVTELTINSEYSSLAGIECFYNLKKITINKATNLTSVDLSKNKQLQEVTITKNGTPALATVNLSDLHALKTVQMGGMTTIETLQLGSVPALESLMVWNTGLTALDVTGAPALNSLAMYGTKVATLDLSKNNKLESASLGATTLATLTLPTEPVLKTLSLDNTLVEALDLSKLTELTEFSAAATKLVNIDLSNSAKLLKLSVGSLGGTGKSTVLKKVDIRKAVQLTTVYLYSDALEEVIVPKGTKTSSWNWSSYHMDPDTGAYSYVTVTEIEVEGGEEPAVDDLAAGIADSFVKKIVLSKADKNGDGMINAAEAENVKELDFSECGLVDGDLAGLEAFPIEKLNLDDNSLTSIDILAFPNLNWLSINNNKLTAISIGKTYTDLKQNLHLEAANNLIATYTGPSYYAKLSYLDLSGNKLTSFSNAYCTAIEYCNLADNQLASISMSGASALKEINVSGNKLTSAAFSGFGKLVKCDVSHNNLTSYSFGASQYSLEEVNLGYNKITSIDISSIAKNAANFALKKVDVTGNEGFNLVIVGAGNQMPEGLEIIGATDYIVLNAANPTGYQTNQYNYISAFTPGTGAQYGEITLNYSLKTNGFKIEDGGEATITAKGSSKVFTFFAVATSGTPQISLSRSSEKAILDKTTDTSPYGASYAATGSNPLSPAMNDSAATNWTSFVVDGNGNKVKYHFSACGKSDGNTVADETIKFSVTGGTVVIFGINLGGYRDDEQ